MARVGRARVFTRALVTSLGITSSVCAFVPLYAMAGGMGSGVGWFYTLYSAWLIACRVLFRRVSDRLGRPRIVTAAIGAVTLAYVVLAFPPSALSRAGTALLYTLVALLVDRTSEAERGLAIGTLSGSCDVGVVVGSLIIGVTVERVSYAAGFVVACVASVLGLVMFVVTERCARGGGVVLDPSPGVSS